MVSHIYETIRYHVKRTIYDIEKFRKKEATPWSYSADTGSLPKNQHRRRQHRSVQVVPSVDFRSCVRPDAKVSNTSLIFRLVLSSR